jgi:hypothetical protein
LALRKAAEEREDGILIRPAVAYTPERKAEFFLTNAISEEDYQRARETVLKMGLDPDKVTHFRPGAR